MYKRNEGADKKTDYKVKDRGDLRKTIPQMLMRNEAEGNTQMEQKIATPESGDSERKTSNQKTEKKTLNTAKKKTIFEELKLKKYIYGVLEKDCTRKKKDYGKDESGKSYPELRKRIRDRYTMKLNGPVKKSDHLSMYTTKKDRGDGSKVTGLKTETKKPITRPKMQIAEETTQIKDKINGSPALSIKSEKKPEKVPVKLDKIGTKPVQISKNLPKRRKPIVNTIMSKEGNVRIFKAVTFVDKINPNPTPLKIKIPNDNTNKIQKVSKYTETCTLKVKPKLTVSKTSTNKTTNKITVKEKMAAVRKKVERRRDQRFKKVLPSNCCLKKEPSEPPTEVARWAPASVDHHTKPYYEAWVDTTLAAITKHAQREKINSSIVRDFRKAFEENPSSTDLFYENYADEKFTGRIKITQRQNQG